MVAPRLAAAVDGLAPAALSGEAFRHVAENHHPLSGAGARSLGGRWNPRESFATLYLALGRETVVREFFRLARSMGLAPEDLLPLLVFAWCFRDVLFAHRRPAQLFAVGAAVFLLAAAGDLASSFIDEPAEVVASACLLAGLGLLTAISLRKELDLDRLAASRAARESQGAIGTPSPPLTASSASRDAPVKYIGAGGSTPR